MSGTIRKRGKNSWAVIVDMGYDSDGKRRQVWRSVQGTKKDAEAYLVQLLHQRNEGFDMPAGRMTVGQYLQRWLDDYVRLSVAPKTLRLYEDIVRRHAGPALGAIALTRLRPQHIQAYYSKLLESGRLDGCGALSAKSVLRHHQMLHQAFKMAVRWQLVLLNPCDAVEPPRAKRTATIMPDPEDVNRLLAAADSNQYGAIVRFAVMTGMRVGEILGLRWTDVDLDARVLHIQQTCQWLPRQGFIFRQPKTATSRRSIALSSETVRDLRRHRQAQLEERLLLGPNYQDNGLVFVTSLGTPIEPSNLRRAWLKILAKSGLSHLRFHDLRHAHATLMLRQGVHPKVVSERLGHASVNITLDTYSHVLPNLQAQAAEQLDALFTAHEPDLLANR